MASGILKVEGTKVVDCNGTPITLRGAGLGGWMKYVSVRDLGLPTLTLAAWKTSLLGIQVMNGHTGKQC